MDANMIQHKSIIAKYSLTNLSIPAYREITFSTRARCTTVHLAEKKTVWAGAAKRMHIPSAARRPSPDREIRASCWSANSNREMGLVVSGESAEMQPPKSGRLTYPRAI